MNGSPQAPKQVDSYRFLDRLTQKLVQSWIGLEAQREGPAEIPWTPLSRPLADSTVALISSAGLALKRDRPFDQEGERHNPWWGDPSYRILPRTATAEDVALYHLHIHPRVVADILKLSEAFIAWFASHPLIRAHEGILLLLPFSFILS